MSEKKSVIFAFRGDPMCFIHVLLNSLDLDQRGMGGTIVIEGEAITLIPVMSQPGHFLNGPYLKARERGLIAGACRACSAKLKLTEKVQQEGIELIGDMAGHPSMGAYREEGFEIITF